MWNEEIRTTFPIAMRPSYRPRSFATGFVARSERLILMW